jgi:hypothetical protein
MLMDFVAALVSGIPSESLQRFYCFTSSVEFMQPLGVRMKWPLCYIACIFRYFTGIELFEDIAKFIDSLERDCETVGDGMAWEQSVRIAILLRLTLAARGGFDVPFKLCPKHKAKGADIAVMYLGADVKTVEHAQEVIFSNKSNFPTNTFVLYVPTEATLQQFDGFCVRYDNYEVRNTSGYQCRDSDKGAVGKVPAWVTNGGHLLRSRAPGKCKYIGQNELGWTYYNASDTDEFLGWSMKMLR